MGQLQAAKYVWNWSRERQGKGVIQNIWKMNAWNIFKLGKKHKPIVPRNSVDFKYKKYEENNPKLHHNQINLKTSDKGKILKEGWDRCFIHREIAIRIHKNFVTRSAHEKLVQNTFKVLTENKPETKRWSTCDNLNRLRKKHSTNSNISHEFWKKSQQTQNRRKFIYLKTASTKKPTADTQWWKTKCFSSKSRNKSKMSALLLLLNIILEVLDSTVGRKRNKRCPIGKEEVILSLCMDDIVYIENPREATKSY